MNLDDTQKIKFTIITVSFNSRENLRSTLLSVANQTYKNVQYIVIDGGSTDGSIDIFNQFKDSIDILICEPDKGIYDAFNKGVAYATGDYISFLNAGDYLDSDYFDEIVKKINHTRYFYYYSKVLLHNKKQVKLIGSEKKRYYTRDISPPYLHPSLLVKKETFDLLGPFSLEYPIYSDFEWMLRLQNSNVPGKFLDIAKVHFFDGGVSSKYNFLEYFAVVRKINSSIYIQIFAFFYYNLFYLKKFFFKYVKNTY
jgi:glycosyltransferase involved in cell wall biosynthesis